MSVEFAARVKRGLQSHEMLSLCFVSSNVYTVRNEKKFTICRLKVTVSSVVILPRWARDNYHFSDNKMARTCDFNSFSMGMLRGAVVLPFGVVNIQRPT